MLRVAVRRRAGSLRGPWLARGTASGPPGQLHESSGAQESEHHAGAQPLASQERKLLQQTIRADLAAEEAATALFRGQRTALCGRLDAALLAEREQEHLAAVRVLAPQHRVRPSLLAPALRAGFFVLGAAAGLAPRRLAAAVSGGMQDALEEVYTEQLRELRGSGLAERATDVRSTVVALRNEERAVEGAPRAPDLLPYLTGGRQLRELSLEESVAALVRFGAKLSIDMARRL